MFKYFFKNNYITAIVVAAVILGLAIKEGIAAVILLMALTIVVAIVGGYVSYMHSKR